MLGIPYLIFFHFFLVVDCMHVCVSIDLFVYFLFVVAD